MNRIFIDKIKLIESIRVPFLGKYLYKWISSIDQKALESTKIPDNPLNRKNRDEFVICSLTSFPARIKYVHLAIKSLMLQTYKPDRIILWLAEEQFPDKKLPEQLLKMERYGLEICWCHDMYGHKKYYYPVLNQKENEVVITFDDDIIYSPLCVARLMKKHKQYPNALVCERGQVLDKTVKDLKNPGRWKTISSVGVKKPTYRMNPSPGGGCLIPYKGFSNDAVNEEKFTKLAYKNDDLWYMFMCADNKTRMVKTRKYHRLFTLINGSQVTQMATENIIGNMNVTIMEGLIEEYPKAYERIVTDKD